MLSTKLNSALKFSSKYGLRTICSSNVSQKETKITGNVAVVPFQQQHVCEIQVLQWFLYLSETPCKLHAEEAELGTALVSQQLCELSHVPPVQTFAVQLVEVFR
ncbi:uncharacterized protein TNCV_1598791 [Trichonephila clavipes]|nr:uncharacterized protein TNCV_1598791 [Trichonephila clavipes]